MRRFDSARLTTGVLVLMLLSTGIGCRAAYYHSMEMIGRDKRQLLANGVAAVRDSQQEAARQFESALEQFTAFTGYRGGELEAMYERLDDAFQESEDRAASVRRQIENVERVSEDLFAEWERELDLYNDQRLRAASEQKLADTRLLYADLLETMHRTERRMQPVLDTFRDQVLFLKHNLNAQAVASLEGNSETLRRDVDLLIEQMETSIAAAERFIRHIEAADAGA